MAAAQVPTSIGRVASASRCSSSALADAATLALGHDVGVPDQVHVAHRLDAHDPEQRAAVLVAPELDPRGDLPVELLAGMYGSCQRSAGITPR